MLKIEILYSPKCKSWTELETLLRQVLSELKAPFEISTREIRNRKEAEEANFLGSPTVKINGQDLEPGAKGMVHLA